jgi:hypothetical protein
LVQGTSRVLERLLDGNLNIDIAASADTFKND